MSDRGRSLQQIDPLTAATSWEAAIVIVLVTWCYVVLATVSSLVHISNMYLMAIAIIFMTLSLGLHLWFAAPRHDRDFQKWNVRHRDTVGKLLCKKMISN